MIKNWMMAAVALFLGAASLRAQTQRIGFVNIKKVYDTLPAKDSAAKKYQAYEKFFEDKLKDIEAEAAKKSADIKSFTATPGYNPDIKALYEEALVRLQNDYYETKQLAEEKLAQQQNILIAPIIEEIKKAAGIVGKQKGYTQVLDNSSGVVLYNGVPNDDLTDAVIKYMLTTPATVTPAPPKK